METWKAAKGEASVSLPRPFRNRASGRAAGWTAIVLAALLLIEPGLHAVEAGERRTARFAADTGIEAVAGQAAGSTASGRVGKTTIVSIPGWSFLDWNEAYLSELPHLSGLIREGAIGGMNVRTPEKGLEDSYATLGAGAPAFSSSAFAARNADEAAPEGRLAVERYVRLTGRVPTGADIIVPEIVAVRRRNDLHSQRSHPGLLGQLLGSRGIAAAVFGNSDTAKGQKRYAALAVMDDNGLVPEGRVDERALLADAQAAFGQRMNVAEWLRMWDSTPSPAVLLLEWGDLLRLQEESPVYDAEQLQRKKTEALRRLDGMLGELRSRQREGDVLWVLSPYVGAEASRRKMLLAPVIYLGADRSGGGLLTSPSTRRDGIVTAADFAPSVLAAYGIAAPAEMTGRPVGVAAVKRGDALSVLMKQIEGIREVYRIRPRVLVPFVSVEAAVLLVALIAVWGRLERLLPWIEAFLLALLAAPLTLLLIGWLTMLYPLPGNEQALLFAALAALAACLLRYCRSVLAAAGWLSGATTLALLLDGLCGAEGMKRSVLGYDVMIGARYYGIGNEYMGVMIGAAVFAFAAVMERQRRRSGEGAIMRAVPTAAEARALVRPARRPGAHAAPAGAATVRAGKPAAAPANALAAPGAPPPSRAAARSHRRRTARAASVLAAAAFAALAFYLAAPRLGTNAGGVITAAVAFGLAWLRSFAALRRQSLPRLALVCAALVAASLAALWLANAAAPAGAGAQSHIGRAMDILAAGRTDLIAAIIVRKLQMNAHLIGVSAWTKVLAAGLLVMAVAVVRPRGALRRWETEHPYYMNAFIAIAIGSVAALAFNDSGIVAAATMIVYAAVPMLLLIVQEDRSSHSA